MKPPPRRSSAPLRAAFVLALLAALAVDCKRTPPEPSQPAGASSPPTAMSGPMAPLPPGHPDPHAMFGQPQAGGGITWDDPPGWQRVPPASAMRRAQYRIPRAAGDDADAELVVITFGPGQGGDIESNLQRWYGQVQQPDGRPSAAVATRQTMMVGSFPVTETEVSGRIGGTSMAMPGVPPAPAIEHGRLLAAIVETNLGPWFFKITGPDATVAAARTPFETMLRSIRPAAH